MARYAANTLLPKYAAATAGLFLAAFPVAAQAPSLAMLDRLEPGLWEVRERGDTGAGDRLCIRDGRSFIQMRHPGPNCARTVVEDGASAVRVHYTCTGRGYGHTAIRYESRQLVQLQSQGIASGMPFSFSAEGRRIGSCPAS